MRNILNNVLADQVSSQVESLKEAIIACDSNGKMICQGYSVPVGPAYQMVDLGLPSGLKWANMNIGATTPEESGLYFAWGETIGHEYTGEGSFSGMFDEDWYNTLSCASLSGDITPDSGYDAARANMGGSWRMPTKSEEDELIAETTQEIVTINGVQGTKFMSKTNENYIFVPFAFLAACGELFVDMVISGLWSASYDKDEKMPYYFGCSNEGSRIVFSEVGYYGFSIRGVSN